MRKLGELFDSDRTRALQVAEQVGVVIGCELVAHGVDFSFTPVLDLDYGASSVIGDRALHADARAAGELAAALIKGLARAGVAAVGKHFPGHGYAKADSHHAVPTDDRALEQIMARDVAPYRSAIAAGLAGVMPAHVIYEKVDREPAGYSRLWLQQVLRGPARLRRRDLQRRPVDGRGEHGGRPGGARTRRSRRAATWCCCARTRRGRMNCSRGWAMSAVKRDAGRRCERAA